jgi:ribosome-binding factor A
MSNKQDQLSSAIDRALREVFSRGFNDPRIGGLLTITGVKVTQDGRECFVDVSVLPAEKGQLSLHGLNAAAPHIRREVGERVRIRTMPRLEFRLDETLKKQARVLSALDRVRDELAAKEPAPTDVDAGAAGEAGGSDGDEVRP